MDYNDQEDVDNYSFRNTNEKPMEREEKAIKQASKRLEKLLALYQFLYLVRGSCRALLKPTWFIIFESTNNTMLVTEGSFKGWPCGYAKLRQYYIFVHIRANMCIYVHRCASPKSGAWSALVLSGTSPTSEYDGVVGGRLAKERREQKSEPKPSFLSATSAPTLL